MSDYRLPWVDRLAEAQWFDRFGFILFAAGGCVAIVLAKVAGLGAIAVSIGALVLMTAYAVVVWRSMVGRLRADQAGDNLYYLGLLYTLTGLAYAIFTFRPEASSTALVEGFGIALSTTIWGLMLRVFFSQVRSDLVEVEDRARMELSEAATALRGQLDKIVRDMNDFGRQTRQSLAEAATEIETEMMGSVSKGTKSLAAMAGKAEAGVASAFENLSERAAALGQAVSDTTGAIEEHAGSTRKWSQSLSKVGSKLDGLASAAEKLESTAAVLQENSSQSAEQVRSAGAIAAEASQTLAGINVLVQTVQQRLLSVADAQDARIAAIEAAPVTSAERVAGLIETISLAVEAQLEKISDGSTAMLDAQLDRLREAIEASVAYNQRLSSELEKSEGYLTRVHDAMVQVANDLTRQIAPEGTLNE